MKKIGAILLTLLMAFSLFGNTAIAAETKTSLNLTTYLNEVSQIRGFDVNQDDIDWALSIYDKSVSDFNTTDELKSSLGEVIKSDLSNLDGIYQKYSLDQTSLTKLLKEYGEDLNDYVYVNDLDEALAFYTDDSITGSMSDVDIESYKEILSQVGVTDSEMIKLEDYITSLSDYLSSAEVQAKLEDLSTRLQAIGTYLVENGSDENFQPSADKIAEMSDIYNELLKTVKLNVTFAATENGVTKEYSFTDLINLAAEGKDLSNADFVVKIYDDNKNLLMDMNVTSDMINSNAGNILKNVGNVIQKEASNVTQTVKGGQLPKTASNSTLYMTFGILVTAVGIVLFRKVRTDKREGNRQ